MTNDIILRPATPDDAEAMAEVQNAIFAAGLRETAVDAEMMRQSYLEGSHSIGVTLAVRDGQAMGFQWLGRAWPGNEYGVTPGSGMIGTHIRPDAGRSGLGRRLFSQTRVAALEAGLTHIEAPIDDENAVALAYYGALGFRPYRKSEGRTQCRFDL